MQIVQCNLESRDILNKILLTDEIIFDSKPDAVPYNYRISYKVAQLCLIISKCCSGRSGCSLVKIHIFSSALNTKEYMKILEDYIFEKIPYMLVRFDPSVNRAVKYAIADKLIIQLKNGTFRLSNKGKQFVLDIEKDNSLLSNEKQYLDKYSKRLTNDKIDVLMSAWRYKNA